MAKPSPVDRLLAESERLREELRRTIDGLREFSTELLAESRLLRHEAAGPNVSLVKDDDKGSDQP